MPEVLLFAQAREAAGVGSVRVEGSSVEELVGALADRFGPAMSEIVAASRVFLNGEPAEGTDLVAEDDEVAVVPPVSGG